MHYFKLLTIESYLKCINNFSIIINKSINIHTVIFGRVAVRKNINTKLKVFASLKETIHEAETEVKDEKTPPHPKNRKFTCAFFTQYSSHIFICPQL